MCKTINHLLTLLTLADLLCGFHRKTMLTTKYIYSPGVDLWHTYREGSVGLVIFEEPPKYCFTPNFNKLPPYTVSYLTDQYLS